MRRQRIGLPARPGEDDGSPGSSSVVMGHANGGSRDHRVAYSHEAHRHPPLGPSKCCTKPRSLQSRALGRTGNSMSPDNQIDRAIILSAGKGARLLPLTAERPRCLIELSGRTLLEGQLDALFAAGIREVFVVTGFKPELVEDVLEAQDDERGKVSTIFNPFFHVADNL